MEHEDNEELSKINQSPRLNSIEMQVCPKCGSTRIISDPEYAEIVCMDCGNTVQQKGVTEETEQVNNGSKQIAGHIKNNDLLTYTIHNTGLSTTVEWNKQSKHSKNLSIQKTQTYRLRGWQRRVRVPDSTEHNFASALSEITKAANKLSLSKDVLEIAVGIYQKALREHLTKGRSIQSMASAALYLAGRQCRAPITLDEIAQTLAVNKREMGKNYRHLVRELNCSIPPPFQPAQYATKFCSQGLSQEKTEKVVHRILAVISENKLMSGCKPAGIVAAANYAAAALVGECITQKEVAAKAHITEAIVKKNYREIEKKLSIEISI